MARSVDRLSRKQLIALYRTGSTYRLTFTRQERSGCTGSHSDEKLFECSLRNMASALREPASNSVAPSHTPQTMYDFNEDVCLIRNREF